MPSSRGRRLRGRAESCVYSAVAETRLPALGLLERRDRFGTSAALAGSLLRMASSCSRRPPLEMQVPHPLAAHRDAAISPHHAPFAADVRGIVDGGEPWSGEERPRRGKAIWSVCAEYGTYAWYGPSGPLLRSGGLLRPRPASWSSPPQRLLDSIAGAGWPELEHESGLAWPPCAMARPHARRSGGDVREASGDEAQLAVSPHHHHGRVTRQQDSWQKGGHERAVDE